MIIRRISSSFSRDFFPKNHFFHTTNHCYYTEETLASHLAPLLRNKDSFDRPSVLHETRQIHAQITVNGLHNIGMLGTKVLGVYILNNNYSAAKDLFTQLHLCHAAPWNWMIRGLTEMGCFEFAILFYFKMLIFGTSPDKYTFPFLIKACGGLHDVELVKHVHCMVRDFGFEMDVYVGSALVKFYAENGCLEDARELFDKLPQRDTVLWNAMLNGYLRCDSLADGVIRLFEEMRRSYVGVDSVTCACVMSLCGAKSMLRVGKQVHGLVVKCGLELISPVDTTLVSMYAKCRCLFDARKLFEFVSQTSHVTWNVMIGGYVQNGLMDEALDIFRRMISSGVKPNSKTFATLLPVVPALGCSSHGKAIHGYIIRHGVLFDLFLKSAVLDMYFKCQDVDLAVKVFDQTPDVDNVICTAMISGFVLNGLNIDALKSFRWLLDKNLKPNAVTFASVLPACAGLVALKPGKEIHCYMIRRGFEGICYVESALTYMYAKCGKLGVAYQVFLRMSERDTICWNTMITACSQNGKPEVAINLFRQMSTEGSKCDCVTISAALSACANLSALHHGKEMHGFMLRGAFSSDIFACSALIDMYAKCGNLHSAQHVFDTMESKNEVSWNSIIAAYGNHGRLTQCLALFHEMENEGFGPDNVTFLAILSACGHTGQVDLGKKYFESMTENYRITPIIEHYACLVDMYSRAGRLEEAFHVINTMPFEADAGIWGTLLGACRVHGNAELAEAASKHLSNLDPGNSGYYVLLANLHANSGKWERVDEIRDVMKARGVEKVPGFSWIELNNSSHMFAAADKSHPECSEIYMILDSLIMELQNEGYVPLTPLVLN